MLLPSMERECDGETLRGFRPGGYRKHVVVITRPFLLSLRGIEISPLNIDSDLPITSGRHAEECLAAAKAKAAKKGEAGQY